MKTGGEPPDNFTRMIGIGTATGGYYALLRIVPALPVGFPDIIVAVVLVSHKYLELFAVYLEAHSHVPVRMARHGAPLEKGVCYLSAGSERVVVERNADGGLCFEKSESEAYPEISPVNEMFRSLVPFGSRAVGVILSGAGNDGAEGLVDLRRGGGIAIVQAINNCLDPQMPLAALEKGSVEKILPDFLMAEFFEKLGTQERKN